MVWWDTSSPLWPAGQLLMERLPEIKFLEIIFYFHFLWKFAWLLMGRRAPEMKSFWTSTMMIALFGRTIWSLSIWITVNKRFSRFENWHLFDREDFKNIEKTWKILRRLEKYWEDFNSIEKTWTSTRRLEVRWSKNKPLLSTCCNNFVNSSKYIFEILRTVTFFIFSFRELAPFWSTCFNNFEYL